MNLWRRDRPHAAAHQAAGVCRRRSRPPRGGRFPTVNPTHFTGQSTDRHGSDDGGRDQVAVERERSKAEARAPFSCFPLRTRSAALTATVGVALPSWFR